MGWEDRHYNQDSFGGGGGGGGFGGLMGRMGKGSMVTWLLGINCVVFLLDAILSTAMRVPSWLSPSFLGEFTVGQGLFGFQVWRYFTYQFLHADFFHLLFNMIGLFFFGPLMEQWWGSKRFLAFYLICGVCGAVIYTALVLAVPGLLFPAGVPAEMVPLVGASGSIFGILAACAVLFPNQRVMLLIPPIPMSMRTMALIFIGIAFLVVVLGANNAGGQAAHLGGAGIGALLAYRPNLLNWADRFSPGAVQEGINRGRYERKRKQEQASEAEVDRILDKVRDQGLASLTKREKKALSQETDRKRSE